MALILQALSPVTLTSSSSSYALAGSTKWAHSVTIQADYANTGTVTIAGSEVTSSNGIQLKAGESAVIEQAPNTKPHEEFDVSLIYATSTQNGDKVRVTLIVRSAS